ncbi:sulfite exporter TauE/SafE family protein [Patescibacteria group bacterium]|nr:sulfite exporter TauE/SafE family protein [Patescibacteria group bacterium]
MMQEKGSLNKCHTIKINGMTCASCEILLNDELSQLDGVDNVKVSLKAQTAEVFVKDESTDIKNVVKKIESLGYSTDLSDSKDIKISEKATLVQWFYALLIVVMLGFIYSWLQEQGLLNWVSVDTSDITFGVAFLVGVVASMSTCLAVVGAVVVSFAAKYESKGNFYDSSVKPQVIFHLGRWATFLVLGAVLGYLGSWFSFSGNLMAWFTIIVAIVLAWLGLNILGITPSITKLGIRMPKNLTSIWSKIKDSNHPLAPVILGGFTFFLPCGFTQSMQLFAVASGNAWVGALTLFFFALGTTPVLFGLGVATAKMKNMNTIVLKKAIGFIVIAFAFYTLSSGFAVLGIKIPSLKSIQPQTVSEVAITDNGEQTIVMTVDYNGFTPNVFTLKKGVPVKWVIKGVQVSGCTSEIIVPEYNIRKKIIQGDNVLNFTPTKEGVISFSCWMGMVRGQFNVES